MNNLKLWGDLAGMGEGGAVVKSQRKKLKKCKKGITEKSKR